MTRSTLRLNLGDPSEARIYYCAHFVAEALGYFAKASVEVQFVTTTEGGQTVRGGQIPALLSGQADLTVGGPMVAMKMEEEGEAHLITICAVAQGNPWIIAAAPELAGVTPDLAALAGKRVIDVARVGTATMSFEWLLEREGLSGQVTLLPGSGDEAADLAAVAEGRVEFALHSLHALAPILARRELCQALELAGPTGAVPWSAYIALPERVARDRNAFEAFTCAIAWAQEWMVRAKPRDIAALVAPHYPDRSVDALALSLAGYLASGVLPGGPEISVESFMRFGAFLQGIGWLSAPPDATRLLDMSLVQACSGRQEEAEWM